MAKIKILCDYCGGREIERPGDLIMAQIFSAVQIDDPTEGIKVRICWTCIKRAMDFTFAEMGKKEGGKK